MTLHKQTSRLSELCPIRDVLDRLGDRWSVLVLGTLAPATLRFGELKKSIPDISPRMLAQTLRHLEQDGLVSRTVFPSIPPRVEYSMTALGVSFFEHVQGMIEWASTHHDAIRQARANYVAPQTYSEK
ncbi:MAG: putative transcriptional regulator [Burkholderiaceae bacterium]|nr:putative transcriptional regulator [Burkholderiaceae bacterium]